MALSLSLPLPQLKLAAQQWLLSDPDENTVEILRSSLALEDETRLRACFEPPMEFGTAGLRGIVGPGPAQMNVAVIRRVTLALSTVVASRAKGDSTSPIVLGFDGRLDSRRFADEAVGVLSAAGCRVAFFREPAPTPLVAFAGLKLGALASVVVTASHNPPEYNGYKVYGADAIQIVPPFDREVTQQTEEGPRACDIAVDREAFDGRTEHATVLGDSMVEAYVQSVVGGRAPGAKAAPLRVAYSPLHGVGAQCFERVLLQAGYVDLHIEPAQKEIDGHFPTVRFPNPEEPSTFDRVIALAKDVSADVVIVNDPDADRMAAALPDIDGHYRILTGNEIGVLLTDYLLAHAEEPRRAVVTSTLVSTPMTRLIAAHYGARFEPTLTGFKWLWTAARMLEQAEGLRFAIAWEEALGYSTHAAVRDKDGIAAGLAFLDFASECVLAGQKPLNRLRQLYRLYGAWGTAPHSLVRTGPEGIEEIAQMMSALTSSPPKTLGGRLVAKVRDFAVMETPRPVYQGFAPMIVLELEPYAKIVVRPSGTEPKLKIYADVCLEVGAEEEPLAVHRKACELAGQLSTQMVAQLQDYLST